MHINHSLQLFLVFIHLFFFMHPRPFFFWSQGKYFCTSLRTISKSESFRTKIYCGAYSRFLGQEREVSGYAGLPRWLSGKESTCKAGDAGLIPGSGRSSEGGHGNPLQYFFLENPMDRITWWTPVHRVAKHGTWLKRLSMHTKWLCWHQERKKKLKLRDEAKDEIGYQA